MEQMQSSSITRLNLTEPCNQQFPKMCRSNNRKLQGFQNFIFHDNFTGNRIVMKQLDNLYSRRKQKRTPLKKRHGQTYHSEEMGQIVKTIQQGFTMLTNTRKFQMDSVRRRDTRYVLPNLSQTLHSKHPLADSSRFFDQDRQCSRLSMKIYQSNKSNFREYLQKEKLPSPKLMKLASMDPRQKRMTKYQQFKMIRMSKLLLMEQQHRDQAQMEYEYRKEQSEQFNLANITNLEATKPVNVARESIRDDYFKSIQTEFMNRINFYVKRTIQENGQYLIEPSIQQLQRLNLMRKLETGKENSQSKDAKENAPAKAQTVATEGDDQAYQRALQVSKLLRRQDKRTQVQKDFIKAIQRNDLFDVSNMLNKNSNLIETKDWGGNNPMHYAAKIGDNEMFQTLFEKGGNISQPNHLNQTAVNICEHFGNTHVLEYIGLQGYRK